MRVAIVGTGFARQVHLPAYLTVDGVQLAAVCDNRPGRAKQVAQEFGAARWCEDYDDLLAMPDIDIVDVCTPPRLHAPMALQAMSAGKAVICEKPMSSDLASAASMATLASQSGLVNAINFQYRYIAAHQMLRKLVTGGYLGDIRLVVTTALAGYALDPRLEPHYATWASMASEGGGFLSSALAHSIDLAQYVFGRLESAAVIKQNALPRKPQLAWDFIHDDPIDETSPTAGTTEVTGDDTAVVQGRLAGGGVMLVAGSWAVNNGSGTRIEAYGSEGTITMDGAGHLTAARGNHSPEPVAVPEQILRRSGTRGDVPGLFAALARDVLAAFNGEEPPADRWPFATFTDGLAVQQVISAPNAS